MHTIAQHRYLTAALFMGTLFALLVRPMSMLFHGLMSRPGIENPVFVPRSLERVVKPIKAQHHRRRKAPAEVKVKDTDFSGWSLKTMWRDYVYTFSGTTLCEGKPCAATIKAVIEADGTDHPIAVTVESGADGTYEFQVPFQALPNRQLDWRMTAISADMHQGESLVRHILSEDPERTLVRDLDLH